MKVMNKFQATSLFMKYAILLDDKDVIPLDIAGEILGYEAIKYAIDKHFASAGNVYSCDIGDISYLTEYGFFRAVTYLNIKEMLKRKTKKTNANIIMFSKLKSCHL